MARGITRQMFTSGGEPEYPYEGDFKLSMKHFVC